MPQIDRESINFKILKTFTSILSKTAKKGTITAIDLIIQSLHHILGDVPSVEASIEVCLYQLEEDFFNFKQNIGKLLAKTERDLTGKVRLEIRDRI